MVLLKTFVENYGDEKGDGLISFEEKEVRTTVVTRPDIGAKLAHEVLDQERDKEGRW